MRGYTVGERRLLAMPYGELVEPDEWEPSIVLLIERGCARWGHRLIVNGRPTRLLEGTELGGIAQRLIRAGVM